MRPRRKPGTTFRWARRLLASLKFFNFPNPDVPEAHFVAVILQVQGRTIMSVYPGRTDPYGRAFKLNVDLNQDAGMKKGIGSVLFYVTGVTKTRCNGDNVVALPNARSP